MNLPLSNRWMGEVDFAPLLSEKIMSFDIWGGISSAERLRGNFKGNDFKYMTLMYSTYSVSIEDVRKEPPAFLNQSDSNVERVLSASVPIVHKSSLIDRTQVAMLNQFFRKFGIAEGNVWTILVPVNESLESRWKATVCFDIEPDVESNPTTFIERHKEELCLISDNIYKMWRLFDGGNFNLYKARGTFCSKAIEIATMLADGYSTKAMAEKLEMTNSGIEYHIESMRYILGAKNRGNLVAELFRKGIIT
ncbi:helix-turn-helix transcriptional regulator [Vibrio sp. HN007]|uniref:helix-turn-helix transcriptional regulator n=1 Tax=Vibrio iocasae TaxID=3098914 RepID=UPI0035D511F0